MSHDTPKPEISEVSSKSFDPAIRDFQPSNIFGGRKSSFDFVNILKVMSYSHRILISSPIATSGIPLMLSYPTSTVVKHNSRQKILSNSITMTRERLKFRNQVWNLSACNKFIVKVME